MSPRRTLLELPLLLPLLLLSWVPSSRAGLGKVVVLAPPELNGSLGDSVTLPCHLQLLPLELETPLVTQITWKRLDLLGDSSIVAEFHWQRGPSIPEPDRVEFVAAKLGANLLNASLIMCELSPGDEANYTCEIQVSTFQTGSASTRLRVFYTPQVSIALYDTGQQDHKETSLTCDAHSNPEPKSYNWSTTTGPLPPYAVPQDFRLLIKPTEESINMTFICRVSNDLGTGQAAMRVLLPGSPRKTSPSALWSLLPIVGIVFVTAMGTLVYSRYFRESCQVHHSGPDHEAVSYAAVKSKASATEDPPTEGTRDQMDRPGDTGAEGGGGDVRGGC